jgi:hypothetical protein
MRPSGAFEFRNLHSNIALIRGRSAEALSPVALMGLPVTQDQATRMSLASLSFVTLGHTASKDPYMKQMPICYTEFYV